LGKAGMTGPPLGPPDGRVGGHDLSRCEEGEDAPAGRCLTPLGGGGHIPGLLLTPQRLGGCARWLAAALLSPMGEAGMTSPPLDPPPDSRGGRHDLSRCGDDEDAPQAAAAGACAPATGRPWVGGKLGPLSAVVCHQNGVLSHIG